MTLGNSGGDLCKCWDSMNSMVNLQIAKIVESFHRSINRVEYQHNTPFYRLLRGMVSVNALKHIASEFDRTKKGVGYEKSRCGCTIRVTHGLPCACEIGVYHVSGNPIPLEVVDTHWTRLSLEEVIEENIKREDTQCDISYAIETIWTRFNGMNLDEKLVFKKAIDEFAFPTTTSMVPPPSKLKTKGAPKKRKQYDVKRDPSYWEHVDEKWKDDTQKSQGNSSKIVTKKPSKRSSSQEGSKQISMQTSQVDMHFLNWFPGPIHQYIESIINVDGDGNCGFRCVAGCLGYGEDCWPLIRQDLIHELTQYHGLYREIFGERLTFLRESLNIVGYGIQPKDKWLTMPDMGYVIATKYNVALVSLSVTGSCTFFPLRGAYSEQKNVKLISIGFVNHNHWVQVPLRSDSPLPQVAPQWERYTSDESMTWLTPYFGRIQLWGFLVNTPIPTYAEIPIVDLTS